MVVAIYGKRFPSEFSESIGKLIDALIKRGIQMTVHSSFLPYLSHNVPAAVGAATFSKHTELKDVDFLLSIGGDGTLLDTASIIRDSKVPVLGINTGRLGFLSNVTLQEVENAVEALVNGDFTLDRRSLIEVSSKNQEFGDFPFALNEVSLLNKDRNSMIAIHTYVNEMFMSTYWADGLIVATPTGSTAYSLSCGGPIVTPDSNNLILTPIAPHNLNVRPFVISNSNKVSMRAEGRSDQFLLTLDSRSYSIDSATIVELNKASFEMNLVNLTGQNFFNTIRNKLGWGLDKRN